MEYIPKLTDKEIEEVHMHFEERLAIYRSRGMDFEKYRDFLLEKIYPLEDDILELGTGNGYTTVSLARQGYQLISIDTDEEAIRTAAARLAYEKVLSNVKFRVMDANNLEFDEGSFKSIIVVNLLHHAPDTGKLLSEADRVLCAKGKIVIADFNLEGQKIIDAVHRKEGGRHDHPVVDWSEIRSFFDVRGYKTAEFESTGHWVLITEKN